MIKWTIILNYNPFHYIWQALESLSLRKISAVTIKSSFNRNKWIYVNTLDENLGFLLKSATLDTPFINATFLSPEGDKLKFLL